MVGEIVAITGGSGFLAQHLIFCLQRTNHHEEGAVIEIRTIDRNSFNKFLGTATFFSEF